MTARTLSTRQGVLFKGYALWHEPTFRAEHASMRALLCWETKIPEMAVDSFADGHQGGNAVHACKSAITWDHMTTFACPKEPIEEVQVSLNLT